MPRRRDLSPAMYSSLKQTVISRTLTNLIIWIRSKICRNVGPYVWISKGTTLGNIFCRKFYISSKTLPIYWSTHGCIHSYIYFVYRPIWFLPYFLRVFFLILLILLFILLVIVNLYKLFSLFKMLNIFSLRCFFVTILHGRVLIVHVLYAMFFFWPNFQEAMLILYFNRESFQIFVSHNLLSQFWTPCISDLVFDLITFFFLIGLGVSHSHAEGQHKEK